MTFKTGVLTLARVQGMFRADTKPREDHMTIALKQSKTQPNLQMCAHAIRALSMDAVQKANSGHPGMPMGMADVATVLFTKFLKYDAKTPLWPDRDRFVLSAGHGSMLLYSLLYLTGYEDMTIEELKNFRQLGSKTAGHPEYGFAAGIETTTGPLGQGVGNAVGMAIAEKLLKAQFSQEIVNHKIYCIAGDGCLMEGISHEAISIAGHLQLNNLIVLFDDNSISIDGPTDLAVSDNQLERFKASSWEVMSIDGHNFEEIEAALTKAQTATKPVLIACKTIIGKGAPHKQGSESTHGSPLGADEVQATREAIGWPFPPFDIPDDILAFWREAGLRGNQARMSWEDRLQNAPHRSEFERRIGGRLPGGHLSPLRDLVRKFVDEKAALATRHSSQAVLDTIVPHIPELLGGSADLTGSVNTKAKGMVEINKGKFDGNYIHYGVREHGMAAAMNGIALHGGFIPYGGTFLVFTDYCRPAIRLSALMELRVIYVMTHDSIGLGEDGPTHQPIEHLPSLRSIPNLNVFRPCDAVEVAECWELALKSEKTPSVLSLTRQKLPLLRNDISENFCAKGAYIIKEASGPREVTLLSTGSEVQIAVEAADILEGKGIKAAVVSMPCWELFDQQPDAYRQAVLGPGTYRIAIEAANPLGWERYVGENGQIVGLNHFGASAPYETVFKEFGLTAEHIVNIVKGRKG